MRCKIVALTELRPVPAFTMFGSESLSWIHQPSQSCVMPPAPAPWLIWFQHNFTSKVWIGSTVEFKWKGVFTIRHRVEELYEVSNQRLKSVFHEYLSSKCFPASQPLCFHVIRWTERWNSRCRTVGCDKCIFSIYIKFICIVFVLILFLS